MYKLEPAKSLNPKPAFVLEPELAPDVWVAAAGVVLEVEASS